MKKLGVALLLIAACTRESDSTETATAVPASPSAVETRANDTQTPPPVAAPAVRGPKLPFADEAAKDPSLVAFREQLLAAVRARDKDRVLALADPEVRTSFGNGGGRADLEKKLDDSLWQELAAILQLGGTFQGDGSEQSFWAPYVFSTFPEAHDAFTSVAVIGDSVPLRAEPSADAPVIATLSRDILTAESGARGGWMKVKTADGRSGYVAHESVRSPISYRAGFTKGASGWKMTALVAGD